MATAPRYRNRVWAMVLSLGTLLPGALQADTLRLDFSAYLVTGTCTLSLDNSTLPLGQVSTSMLRPRTLLNPRPFTLHVSDCTAGANGMKPVVTVTGRGERQDGKFLFRQPDTDAAQNVGILVFKTSKVPGYGNTEIADGDFFKLDGAPVTPANQDHIFYAAVSCGSDAGCKNIGTGNVKAMLTFSFAYQ